MLFRQAVSLQTGVIYSGSIVSVNHTPAGTSNEFRIFNKTCAGPQKQTEFFGGSIASSRLDSWRPLLRTSTVLFYSRCSNSKKLFKSIKRSALRAGLLDFLDQLVFEMYSEGI